MSAAPRHVPHGRPRLVRFRPMTPTDLPAVAGVERSSYTGLEFIVRHAPARYCRGSDPQTMREYVRQRYPHLSYYDAPKRVLALIDAICADGAPGGTREPVEG